MPDATARAPVSRCQARPKAARPDYREDMLCASTACTVVSFHRTDVPVCRIHETKYARWGDSAEQQAAEQWGWSAPVERASDPTGDVARRLRSLQA